jgi:hypothetical protein
MPRKIDPGTLKTGPGFTSVEKEATENLGGATPGLTSHVEAGGGAHSAAAIDIDRKPPLYDGDNVEDALDELSALVPPRPPNVGEFSTVVTLSGIPDWGHLKMVDNYLAFSPSSPDPSLIYGAWTNFVEPTDEDPPFTVKNVDPITDPTFNVIDGTYTGGGLGDFTHSGAFTRDIGGPNPLNQTTRITSSSGVGGGKPIVISGVVYPADRGVLALLRWPPSGDTTAFLAQDLTVRCPAAIRLGSGVNSGCDGLVGGMFTLGDGGSGFDPFAYPGQASGQYDLRELHTGVSTIDATALPIVADTTSGQVRLGTDVNAGVPVVAGGIPILGAGTVATGGGNDDNFFRYRLPYLNDYSDGTNGLLYTPAAQKPRYFLKPSVSLTPGTDLVQAGDYPDFPKDYWTFQVARYRHRFTLDDTAILPSDPRDNGSWMLLHFRTEEAFEALVRDGVAPADEDLYSPNLVDWTNPENPLNVVADDSASGFPAAPSYHILRASIFEDPDGDTAPTITSASYDYTPTLDAVMFVSGIAYFLVRDGSGNLLTLDNITFNADDLFLNSYRTAEPGITGDSFLGNVNPMVIAISHFANETLPTVPGAIIQSASYVRRRRLELTYQELGSFTIADGPLPADSAIYDTGAGANPILPLGDVSEPAFSTNANLRGFLRKPLAHRNPFTANLPSPGPILIPPLDTMSVLVHSTDSRSGTVLYGNILVAPGTIEATLESPQKDVEERFLDEVYRYSETWDGLAAAVLSQLQGPGLPGAVSPIEVDVRAATTATYTTASWIQNSRHLDDLTAGPASSELQVAGLPDLSPELEYEELEPFPSSGIVIYPQTDYSTGHRPADPGDVTGAQRDYSTATGDRAYIRAFDVAFSRSASPRSPEGQPFFTIKLLGVRRSTFAYVGPGPGSADVAILVKVPGLTTWMDLGRVDGDGPSKQDGLLDGAGCQVVGPETFDDDPSDSGVRFAQVKVNVGPTATLFKSVNGEVPVLVKVLIRDTAGGRALDFTQGSVTGSLGSHTGVIGIEII